MNGFIARSAQMAADSISAIDSEVAAVRAISINTSVSPALAADVQNLQSLINQWPTTLRAQAQKTLTEVVTDDTQLATTWKGVDRSSAAPMLGFAETLRSKLKTDTDGITALNGSMAQFRTSADASVSHLNTDLQSVQQQLAHEQSLANSLAQQVRNQQKRIEYYKSHPWKLVLDGLTIVGLIEDLKNLIDGQNRAQKALSELQRIEPKIEALANARGPLLQLTTALMGLGGGLTNMQTAMTQLSNTLTGIISEKPAAPIIAAEIEAAMQDLASASAIAKQVMS